MENEKERAITRSKQYGARTYLRESATSPTAFQDKKQVFPLFFYAAN